MKNKYIFYILEEYVNETTKNYKDISVTRDYKILFDIAENKGPKNFLIILGSFLDTAVGPPVNWKERWKFQITGFYQNLILNIIFEKESTNKWLKAYENSFIRL